MYDPAKVDPAVLETALAETRMETELAGAEAARAGQEPIPDYAFDCHTMVGKRAGKTKEEFFIEEQDALTPRQAGLFDQDLEDLRNRNQ